MTSTKQYEKMDKLERVPIFCTTVLTVELLTDFTRNNLKVMDEGVPLPAIMTSTNFDEALLSRPDETWIKPFVDKGSTFLGWKPDEIQAFVYSRKDKEIDPWPIETFGILDLLSTVDSDEPTHRTMLLCSTMPDFNEQTGIYLKTCRVKFEDFPNDVCRLETMITRPSEIGKDICLSFAIPLIFEGVDIARARVSYGLENVNPYSREHLAMQIFGRGCVGRYFVRSTIDGSST